MANTTKIDLDAKSLRDTVQALRTLEPSVLKGMGKNLRRIAGQLRGAAQARYSQQFKGSGAYSSKVSLGKRRVFMRVMARGGSKANGNDWSTPGVKAAVMEFYGTKGARTPQAEGTRDWLNAKYRSSGRILYAAWDERKAELQLAARTAVTEAERAANRKLMGR